MVDMGCPLYSILTSNILFISLFVIRDITFSEKNTYNNMLLGKRFLSYEKFSTAVPSTKFSTRYRLLATA